MKQLTISICLFFLFTNCTQKTDTYKDEVKQFQYKLNTQYKIIMNILCNNVKLRDKAIYFANQLGISDSKVTLNIFRLPHPDKRQGFIDYPHNARVNMYMEMFVKYDEERYITLAHEMVHVRQVINHESIDEIEAETLAYRLNKTLDNAT